MAAEELTVENLDSPSLSSRSSNANKPKLRDERIKGISEQDLNRIIEMAWEDRTSFEAIEIQFGLKESDVKDIMKRNLKFSSYKRWRIRVENCNTKHAMKRVEGITRFKCNLQRSISLNKISKRK